jgi:hypothetical protein
MLGVETQVSNITVTNVLPKSGPTQGGQTIRINGTNFPYAPTSGYETDGLVLQLDAINNTGNGDTNHSSTATTWKDISGNNYDLNLRRTGSVQADMTECDTASWKSAAFKFANYCYFARGTTIPTTKEAAASNTDLKLSTYMPTLPLGNSNYTFEMVYTPTNTAASIIAFGSAGNTGQANQFRLCGQATGKQCLHHFWWTNDYDYKVPLVTGSVTSSTVTYDNTIGRQGYFEGSTSNVTEETSAKSNKNANIADCGPFIVGKGLASDKTDVCGTSVTHSDQFANGLELRAIRIYDRPLEQAEIEANFAVDKVRFIDPPVVKVGGVQCTDVAVLSTTQMTCKTGAHAAAENVPVVINYDGAQSAPANVYNYRDMSISSVTPNVGSVNGGQTVKINGSNFPYASSDDYVKDGIVLQLDAINNTGFGDRQHSSTAPKWVDVSGNGYDLDLRKAGVVQSNLTNCDTTSWEPAAFKFANNCYFARGTTTQSIGTSPPTSSALKLSTYMPKIPLGNSNYTLETVYKPAVGNGGIIAYGQMGVNNKSNQFRLNGQAGGKQQLKNFWWSNDYYFNVPLASGAVTSNTVTYDKTRGRQGYFDASTAQVTNETGPKGNTNADVVDCGPFYVGKGLYAGAEDRCGANENVEDQYANGVELRGVRIYDRVLTDAEIQQNYALDNVRFQSLPQITIGGSPCENVVILSSSTMQCTTTAHAAGDANLSVNWSGFQATTSTPVYTYASDSTLYINSSSPAMGPKYAAGQVLTLNGNFPTDLTAVTVAGAPCTSLNKTSPTTFTCVIPALGDGQTVGSKDVKITYSGGTQTLTGAFEYLDASNDPVKYRVQRSAGLANGNYYEYTLAGADGNGGLEVEPAWTGISQVVITYPKVLGQTTSPVPGWSLDLESNDPTNKVLTFTANTLQTSEAVEHMLKSLVWKKTDNTSANVGGTIKVQLINGLW